MNAQNTKSGLIVEKPISTKVDGKDVEIKMRFDFTGVPNASLLVLATRAIVINLQRGWRKLTVDEYKKLDGTTFNVHEYLTKNPVRTTTRASKVKKFAMQAKALGLGRAEIVTILKQKGYDDTEFAHVLDKIFADKNETETESSK